MKKTLIILALAAMALAVFPLTAGAAYFEINTHGGWGTSYAGCADCHTTHAADAAFLLKTNGGSTQTDACYACHRSGEIASPYDVANGAIFTNYDYDRTPRVKVTAGTVYPSYAGGFNRSYAFAAGTDGPQNSVVVAADRWTASDSAHNVEQPTENNIPGTAWDTVADMPGGATPVNGNIFKCGSCHDPHAGAKANTKARLLRNDLPTAGQEDINFETGGTVNLTTYRVDAYPETINAWCGGCHNYFDAPDKAGHTIDANNKYRHPMGVVVDHDAPADATIAYGTPLAKTSGELICFSCHRAHGTAATMQGAATSFVRYNDGSTVTSSALLRLPDRKTCYNCHGAAEKNTWTDYGGVAHVAH